MCKPSVLEGCMDWHVATNLKHNIICPTETALMTKHSDIVIWSVKTKKVFVIELTVPFEENLTGHISISWKNMWICKNDMSEMAG